MNWSVPESRLQGDSSTVETAPWAPAVDIKEEKDRFLLQADLPGIKPDDIDITMEKGVLTIKGERKTEANDKGEGYARIERKHGSFYRRFFHYLILLMRQVSRLRVIMVCWKSAFLKPVEVQPKKDSGYILNIWMQANNENGAVRPRFFTRILICDRKYLTYKSINYKIKID